MGCCCCQWPLADSDTAPQDNLAMKTYKASDTTPDTRGPHWHAGPGPRIRQLVARSAEHCGFLRQVMSLRQYRYRYRGGGRLQGLYLARQSGRRALGGLSRVAVGQAQAGQLAGVSPARWFGKRALASWHWQLDPMHVPNPSAGPRAGGPPLARPRRHAFAQGTNPTEQT